MWFQVYASLGGIPLFKRVRRRYLALRVESGKKVEEEELIHAIWKTMLQLFGEYGANKAGLSLIEYNKHKNLAILRCSHVALPMVRTVIASVIKINEKSAALHVLGVSGTLRALRKQTQQA